MQKRKRSPLLDYLFIILGICIYSVGFTVFILPHGIVVGGMAGLATLVYYASSETIPVAVTIFGVNILLLAIGFRFLGRDFAIKTIFGFTVLSMVIGAMEGYFTSHPPFVSDTLVSLLMGGVLMGLGIGTYYSHHGTTGGTDIIAAIMTKLSDTSVGRVMMVFDMTVVALSFFLPFDGDIEMRVQSRAQTIIFGWMTIFVYSVITDRFLQQGIQTVQFFILSDRWEEIAYRITHETGRGATIWEAKGYWTGTSRTMMMVWCRRPDMAMMYEIVKDVDPEAYITATNTVSVYGNGFDRLIKRVPTKAKG
ncbi:MAG: YitT family protein [Duncaniella sp.]|nr:YitT family protein [Duncaniella sp.]